jgi:CDP-2,3-bis-(O-geranylgeranyl)-sn-glycerol synthase
MVLNFLIKFFPAMIANSSPVIFTRIPWNWPVHGRLFGPNKTWRGLILGTLAGGLVGHLLGLVYPLLDWQVGLQMSFGALVGDLIKSFFKRRVGKDAGRDWMPFDQIDWIIGALALSWWLFSPLEMVLLFVTLPGLHILTNRLAIQLKLKRPRI